VDAVRTPTLSYAAVALGAAIGGGMRWFASELAHGWLGTGFPWGTLFVNVTGSFAIGCYAALVGPAGRLRAGPRQRLFVMTGICGGYTTFSAFSLETLALLQAGSIALASLNAAGSVTAWLLAVWSGYALAMRLSRVGAPRA
jgi:CrcB protein